MKDPLVHTRLERIDGPLVMLSGLSGIRYGESVYLEDRDGRLRQGRVVLLDHDRAAVEVFEGTEGISKRNNRVRFMGEPITISLDASMIGRRMDGMGRPIDGGPPLSGQARDVNGSALNPVARDYPVDFIQTGISAIDGMISLVRGQKLPVFTAPGLPHDRLAIQIARQSKIRPDLHGKQQQSKDEARQLVVVFAAIGVKHDVASRFTEEIGGQTVTFLNLADDPAMERLLTPRMALTAAEYLAFDLGMHVLVLMTDMTNYGEALREIGTARGDVPSRKGYPGYLYSDLASLFERAGRIKGRSGSITQIPVLTMPNDDITHPIPDLTGYITEGQIVLSRELFRQEVYPPVASLPSLSRLMKDGVGEGMTRSDHFPLMGQLYAAYARAEEARMMSRIIGEADLSAVDQAYMRFGTLFERHFLRQGHEEERSLEETLDIGWRCLGSLPASELTRLPQDLLRQRQELLDLGIENGHE
ncbi:MAG TPA: V-type ATP synthase subunit B [Mariprofundaceae bacterium]|nr:V-type ATP synthase subunit B [Mariprofundaceae bacterium]